MKIFSSVCVRPAAVLYLYGQRTGAAETGSGTTAVSRGQEEMMKSVYEMRNISMMMDLYEMTMSNGYFLDPDQQGTKVAFDVFYRRNPDGGGFAIFAGLEQIVDYLTNMHFDEADIAYLRR